jgi:hypothetical protein
MKENIDTRLQAGHTGHSAAKAVSKEQMLRELAEGTELVKVSLLHNCAVPTVQTGQPPATTGQAECFRKDVAAFGRLMHGFLVGIEQDITGFVLLSLFGTIWFSFPGPV